MKYYLYVLDNDKRIRCGKEILHLNEGDPIRKDGIYYRTENKFFDYDENFVDINVHIDE